MKKKTVIVTSILMFISILIFIFISCAIALDNTGNYVTLLLWLFNILLSVGGVSLLYEKFKESQNKAVSGFYVNMQVLLQRLDLFLGDRKNWTSADVFWRFVSKEIASKQDLEHIDPELLKDFEAFSEFFFKFMTESKDNIPPTNDIKGWYENEKILVKFLLFGIRCNSELSRYYKNTSDVENFFKQVIESVDDISKKISCKINDYHKALNPKDKSLKKKCKMVVRPDPSNASLTGTVL